MKPWMAANTIMLLMLEHAGWTASFGSEASLLALAHQQAKPVQELVTARTQNFAFP